MVVNVYLEACLGGISLDLLSVDDNLDYSVPHLLTYVVSCVQLGMGGGEKDVVEEKMTQKRKR